MGSYLFQERRRFPESWATRKSSILVGFFPWNKPQPLGGIPIYGNPHIWVEDLDGAHVFGAWVFYDWYHQSQPVFNKLVGGLEPWNLMTIHSVGNFIIPTDFNSIIFQRARGLNHQPVFLSHYYPILIHIKPYKPNIKAIYLKPPTIIFQTLNHQPARLFQLSARCYTSSLYGGDPARNAGFSPWENGRVNPQNKGPRSIAFSCLRSGWMLSFQVDVTNWS